jgi:DNA (cytosine-5)-methyltransferase 1
VNGPRIGSLCSGYGGLDLAAIDALGAGEVAWHAQWEPPDKDGRPDVHQWAARILAHRFPGVPNHDDITAIDFRHVEPVDVLTAGFPCTDISLAGLGAGIAPGTRSGIWSHVARAVAELRPRLVLIENVRSLASARAHSDLEPCPWCLGDLDGRPVLRALGAVLGDLADVGFDAEWLCLPASGVGAPHQRFRCFIAAWPAVEDPDQQPGQQRRLAASGQAQGWRAWPDAEGRGGAPAADADRNLLRQQPVPDARRGSTAEPEHDGRRWGVYELAIRRWESVTGRPAPAAIDVRGRLNPAFAEWMMGLPAGWVTAVPGITYAAQLKAIGNGVVPQQGAAAIRALMDRAEPLRRILGDLQRQPRPALPQAA